MTEQHPSRSATLKASLLAVFALSVFVSSPAAAKNCKKGCACGDACIPCNHVCHSGGASSYSPPPRAFAAHEPAPTPLPKPSSLHPVAHAEHPAPHSAPSAPSPPRQPRPPPAAPPPVRPNAVDTPQPTKPEEPLSPAWLLPAVPLSIGGLVAFRRARRKARELEEMNETARIAEEESVAQRKAFARAERDRISTLLSAAVPLIDSAAATSLAAGAYEAKNQCAEVVISFDSLSTFEDADRWDEDASKIRDSLLSCCDEINNFIHQSTVIISTYKLEPSDEKAVADSRLALAKQTLAPLSPLLDELQSSAMGLDDRIEATPNTKKAQSAVLRELRAQKKELQVRKREQRTSMAELRTEARLASEAAKPSAWAGSYSKKMAADERREIRRQKDSALLPHESELAGIDRQLLSLDRKINWIQRFGDSPEEE